MVHIGTGCPKFKFPNLKLSTVETIVQKFMKFCVGHIEGMGICLSEKKNVFKISPPEGVFG